MGLKKLTRCQSCLMHDPLCICQMLHAVETTTRVLMVIHAKEIPKPSNTGRLVPRCLSNSDLVIHGRRPQSEMPLQNEHPGHYGHPGHSERSEESQTSRLRLPIPSDYMPLVLFPSPQAQVLEESFVQSIATPICLIVPDGNWNQGSRIPKRYPIMRDSQHVILPPGAPSEYRLRTEPRQPYGLATMEAVARALQVIEGEKVYQHLMHVFRTMVERALWTKGELPAEQVYGGLDPRRFHDWLCNASHRYSQIK